MRAIDVRAKEGYFHEKKVSLLAKEDKIEDDFEKQVPLPLRYLYLHFLWSFDLTG